MPAESVVDTSVPVQESVIETPAVEEESTVEEVVEENANTSDEGFLSYISKSFWWLLGYK